jgi:hypothetical protein
VNDKKLLQRTVAVHTATDHYRFGEGGVMAITRNEDGDVLVFFNPNEDHKTQKLLIVPAVALRLVEVELMEPPMVQPATFIPKVQQ